MPATFTAEQLLPIAPDSIATACALMATYNPRYAHLDYDNHIDLIKALPYEHKPLPIPWLQRIAAGEEAPEFDQDFTLTTLKRSLVEPLTQSAYWPRIKALNLHKESTLDLLESFDLSHIERLHFQSFDDKAHTAPPLSLPALHALRCNGQMKSLKKLAKAYDFSSHIDTLHLEGGLRATGASLLKPGTLPQLQKLSLNVMLKPDKLASHFQDASWPLRHLDIGTNTLHPSVADTLKTTPFYSHLQELRLRGSSVRAPTIKAFLDHPFESLHTLDVRSAMTYAALSKAPAGPQILRAVAASSPLPVENLLANFSPEPKSLRALATSHALPNLKRLYLHGERSDRDAIGYGAYNVADILHDPSIVTEAPPTPDDLAALKELSPLLDRDVVAILFF